MRWHFPAERGNAGEAGDLRHVLYMYWYSKSSSVGMFFQTLNWNSVSGCGPNTRRRRVGSPTLDVLGRPTYPCPKVLAAQLEARAVRETGLLSRLQLRGKLRCG